MMLSKQVKLIFDDGRALTADFTLWETAPENEDQVRLDLTFADEVLSVNADSFFDALVEMRILLEERGGRPKCFGACREVYPSAMIRSMGSGDQAYRLKLGCQAQNADLVSIFDSDDQLVPASVGEQEEFYRKWLKSLK